MADEQENIKLQFDSNAKTVAGDVNKLGASIESTTQSTNENNQAVEQGEQSYKTFKTQLREANQELQKSIQLYGETSAETVKAAKAVANLKDQMGFAQDLADKFNPDQKMKALGAATQVAGTGLQGVTAGMALFGGESEDTQKQLLKVQAAMAFSDAISNLSNLGDQWKLLKTTIKSSSIATKANTAATGAAAMVQNLFTGSVTTTTAGFKALKFAIAATGIGLLIVGLGLVVANFEKISKWAMSFGWIKATAGWIGDLANSITDFIGVTSEADRALDRMKANADASLALNKKFLAEHGSQLDEFTKQKIEAKNKYNEAIKEDGADQVALAKELNRELAKIEYSRGDEERKIQAENAEKAKDEAEKRRKEEADELQSIKDEQLEKDMQSAKDAVAILDELKKNEETPAQKEQREYEEKKAILEANNLSTEELTRQHFIKIAEIEDEERQKTADAKKESDDKKIAKQKETDDFLLELENQKENSKKEIAEKAIGFLKVIAGKNKVIQKAAIIADGVISVARSIKNTMMGNAGALAQSILQLGPIAGPPAATPAITLNTVAGTLSVATTVAQTAKALQAVGGGGGVSGGSVPSVGGGSASAPPTVAFNNTAENQIGQSVAKTQAEQPPLQVIVAESDITNAQNNVKVLENKNKF